MSSDYEKFKTRQDIDDELARLELFCGQCGKFAEQCEKCNTEKLKWILKGIRNKLK